VSWIGDPAREALDLSIEEAPYREAVEPPIIASVEVADRVLGCLSRQLTDKQQLPPEPGLPRREARRRSHA
jgi:hypothetical protein